MTNTKLSTRLALVFGLALTACAGPALARGDGGGGAGGGEKGNVMQPMNIQNNQNIQLPPKPKKKIARIQTQRCGGLTTGATTACQYGGPQL